MGDDGFFSVGLFVPLQIHCFLVLGALVLQSNCQQVFQASQIHNNDQHWLSHPRAPELCAQAFSGLEGTSIKGFALDRAFVVTTPGLAFRQNVDSILNQGGHSTTHCHFHKYAKAHSSDKIKGYPEVLRMKDSIRVKAKQGSDFKLFKHVPLSIRCKDDMLTPQGVAQNVKLGEYLAKSYFKSLSSLSPSISNIRGLAYTVGDERLYQSMHAVLYGLLTEKQFVNAEVEKLSHHFTDDSNLRVKIQDHISHYVTGAFNKEHHLFKDGSYPTGNRWSIDSEFGREISAKDILSSVPLKECDKLIKGAVHLSDDLMESILSVSDTHNRYLLNSSVFNNYSKSISLPFRKFLNSWISSLNNENDFKLISVDEMFMLSLLSVLGGDIIEHIPPVSRLVIERFHFQSRTHGQSQPSPASRSNILPMSLPSSSSHSSHTSFTTQMPPQPKVKEESNYGLKYSSIAIDVRDVYFRVLYNGKVITPNLSNCHSDPLVSLGLCRMPSFVVSLMHDEADLFRDEL